MANNTRRNFFILVGIAYTVFSIILLFSIRKTNVQEPPKAAPPSEVYKVSENTEPEKAVAEVEVPEPVVDTVSEDIVEEEIFYDVPCLNYNKSNVMIRNGPSLKNKVIGKIRPKATAVALYLSKDERVWTAVSYNGILGYSSLDVLELEWDEAVESSYSEEFFIENGLDPKGSTAPGGGEKP